MKSVLLATLLACAAVFLAGCPDGGGGGVCPHRAGSKLCGYCYEDAATSDSPYAGVCRYCPTGSTCQGEVCGEIRCVRTTTNGGGGTTYYASCSQCDGDPISYRGPSYSTCNYYYRLCLEYNCGRILDNCR